MCAPSGSWPSARRGAACSAPTATVSPTIRPWRAWTAPWPTRPRSGTAGKLFASKEDGLPYEIDPETLETLGRYDWDGRLKTQTVTAHPKVDPETGELLFFGYEAAGDATRDISFCVADKATAS